jgi:hypothetical protein
VQGGAVITVSVYVVALLLGVAVRACVARAPLPRPFHYTIRSKAFDDEGWTSCFATLDAAEAERIRMRELMAGRITFLEIS